VYVAVVLVMAATTSGRFSVKRVQKLGKNVDIFSKTLTEITGKLHKRAVEAAPGGRNVVLSPFSISVSLGMSLLGARENTEAELQRFTMWRWDEPTEPDVHNVMRKMILKATDAKKSQFNMTNGMFLDQDYKVGSEYSRELTENYRVEQESKDFQNSPSEALESINEWIEERTDLEEVLPEGAITADTKIALVNVVNFMGKWDVAFEKETKELPFYPDFDKETAMQVEFLVKNKMPVLIYRGYRSNLANRGTFVAIPYKTAAGDPTSYFVVGRPNSKQDLDYINNNLGSVLSELKHVDTYPNGNWGSVKLDIKMPKFDVSQDLDVKEVLKKEGVRDLFDMNNCDLSGITGGVQNGLYVSDYLHKARVQVDAEGTKAAAATVQLVSFRSARRPPPPVTLDVPFFFGIYYARTNSFMFTGVINDPTQQ